MDIQYFIDQLMVFLKPADVVSIMIVMMATQYLKLSFPRRLRPFLAFGFGWLVAMAWAIKSGGWLDVPFYGFVYGAGAAFARQLWRSIRNKP